MTRKNIKRTNYELTWVPILYYGVALKNRDSNVRLGLSGSFYYGTGYNDENFFSYPFITSGCRITIRIEYCSL